MSQYEFPPFEPFMVGESSSQSNPGTQISMKRTRTSSKIVRREKKKTPKAVLTRGLPSGYYEIPVRIYTKIYFNCGQGFYETNQSTGAPTASFGAGIGYATALDQQYWYIGGFGVYTTTAQTIPNFANLQTVFDTCKIVSVKHDFWFGAQPGGPSMPEYAATTDNLRATGIDVPEMWIVNDRNNSNPGNSVDEICQYSKTKVIRGDNRRHTISYTPYIRTSIGTSADESGTTDTLSQSTPATYCQTTKPAAIHMGLRGIFMTSSVNNVALQGYLHIVTTQVRRYKMIN